MSIPSISYISGPIGSVHGLIHVSGIGFVNVGMGFVNVGIGFVYVGMGFVNVGIGFVYVGIGFVIVGIDVGAGVCIVVNVGIGVVFTGICVTIDISGSLIPLKFLLFSKVSAFAVMLSIGTANIAVAAMAVKVFLKLAFIMILLYK